MSTSEPPIMPSLHPAMPFAQQAAIARLEAGAGQVSGPIIIGSKPETPPDRVKETAIIKLTIFEDAPSDRTHIATSRLAFAKTNAGTFIIQQFAGRSKSNETVWAKLPIFDLTGQEPEPGPALEQPPA